MQECRLKQESCKSTLTQSHSENSSNRIDLDTRGGEGIRARPEFVFHSAGKSDVTAHDRDPVDMLKTTKGHTIPTMGCHILSPEITKIADPHQIASTDLRLERRSFTCEKQCSNARMRRF